MTEPNFPPMGATVILSTTFGSRWARDADGCWMSEEGLLDLPGYDLWCKTLDLVYRMQQERDQLKARVAQFDALAQEAKRREAWVQGVSDDETWRDGEELLDALAQLVQEVTP